MSELLVSTSGFDGRGSERPSPNSESSPSCRRSSDFPSMLSRPSSSDACATIVQGLMAFNLSPDEEFSRKACESLVKKMKDKRDELDALIVAVYSRGEDSKKCITISRTLDGRLQVAGRKGFPHVVYAKIFRWPDLHKNELKHLTLCENAFDLKADNVCVNPFHYERVLNAGMGQMDLGKDDDDVGEETRTFINMLQQKPMPQMANISTAPQMQGLQMAPPRTTAMPQKPMISPNAAHFSGNRFLNFNNQMVHAHPHPMMQMQHPLGQMPGQMPGPIPGQMPGHLPQQIPQQHLPMTTMAPPPHPMGPLAQQQHMMPPAAMSMAPTTSQVTAFPPPKQKPPTAPTMPVIDLVIDPEEQSPHYKGIDNLRFAKKNYVCVTNSEPPDAIGPLCWSSLVYHERTKTIAQYESKMSTIFIDCGFATGGNRWCLGNETNSSRDPETQQVRQMIAKGVRLSCKESGDVWIHVYSHTPVFVQSHYLDRESGRGAGDVIHKIYPGARIKIFDMDKCIRTMKEQWLSQMMSRCKLASNQVADDDIAVDVEGTGPSDDAPPQRLLARNDVNDPFQEMLKYCVARISFVKGWGPDYEGRASITDCPCWIEIKMNKAYKSLDHLLTEVNGNENAVPRS